MSYEYTTHTAEALTDAGLHQLMLSEQAKQSASARRSRITKDVIAELEQKAASRHKLDRLTEGTIKATVDNRASSDPSWKSKVGLNRWHIDQATMYFLAALTVGREEDKENRDGLASA